MPNRSHASVLRWLFCCAACLATPELFGQEPNPKQVIVVESWVVMIDFAKLRSLDLTLGQLDGRGQSRTVKIANVLAGKSDCPQLLRRPDELLKLLQQTGVARVLTEPKIAAVSGQKATFEIGRPDDGLKIETTSVAKGNGRIRVEYRAEINEPLRGPRGLRALFSSDPPGKRQMAMSFVSENEPGVVSLDATHALSMPNSPTPVPIVLMRATLEKPTSLEPAATTANAAYREIR